MKYSSIILLSACLAVAVPSRTGAVSYASDNTDAARDARRQAETQAQTDRDNGSQAARRADFLVRKAERDAAADVRRGRIQVLTPEEHRAWAEAGRTDAALDAIEAARTTDAAIDTASVPGTGRTTDDSDAAFRRVRLAVVAVLVLTLFLVWLVQRRQNRPANGR